MKKPLPLFALLISSFFISSCDFIWKYLPKGDSEVKLIPVKSGDNYQFIDREGKIVINPQFSQATVFRNGLSLVQTSGENPKWGFISEDGKFVINATYKYATVFSDDLAWVVAENAAPTAINSDGEIKVTLQDAEIVKIFKEGLSAYAVTDTSGSKWGFVDNTGKVTINPQFSFTGNFSDGKCAVKNKEGKWGYIDKDGKIVINYQFDEATEFIDGKAIVAAGEKAGVIDETGKYIINPQFSDMMPDGDLFLINQDGKWGWCDNDGKMIINPQFEQALPFKESDLAAVQSGKSWGYIDKEGKIKINPQFEGALPFNGKLAVVVSGNKVGLIDPEGKYTINPQFDKIAKDLAMFMVDGSSAYEYVETDFFNVNSIVSRISVEKPEGLTLSSKLSDVVAKLKVDENQFSQYGYEHLLINYEKITNDIHLNFYVYSDAYTQSYDPYEPYSNYLRVFNPDAVIQGFSYKISLSGSGAGKEKDVMGAIEKSLSGYKKDEAQSREDYLFYSNDKQTIILYNDKTQVVVSITNKQPDYSMPGSDSTKYYSGY